MILKPRFENVKSVLTLLSPASKMIVATLATALIAGTLTAQKINAEYESGDTSFVEDDAEIRAAFEALKIEMENAGSECPLIYSAFAAYYRSQRMGKDTIHIHHYHNVPDPELVQQQVDSIVDAERKKMNVADSAWTVSGKVDTVFIRDTIDISRETIANKADTIVNSLLGDQALVESFEGMTSAELEQLKKELEKTYEEVKNKEKENLIREELNLLEKQDLEKDSYGFKRRRLLRLVIGIKDLGIDIAVGTGAVLGGVVYGLYQAGNYTYQGVKWMYNKLKDLAPTIIINECDCEEEARERAEKEAKKKRGKNKKGRKIPNSKKPKFQKGLDCPGYGY